MRSLTQPRALERLAAALAPREGLLARVARELTVRCQELTAQISKLTLEIAARVSTLAPTLLTICGCGPLTAAKIVAETASVERFRSAAAYARHNGTAPLPVSSAGSAHHRLSRTGNRQLNAALYRIAITQARCHPRGKTLLARRTAAGNTRREALRVLKRRLSDVVYQALRKDTQATIPITT